MPAGSKPGERRGGRQVGTPNRRTIELKEMIHAALQAVGGQKYLQKQAIDNPAAFLTLVGKTVPKDLRVDTHDATLEQLLALADQREKVLPALAPPLRLVQGNKGP